MKILAIAASNNRHSINRELAAYAATLITEAEVEVLDIHDYEMPIFSDQREQHFGQPLQARNFYRKIGSADALVIAFAEHNGSYTAAWKNLFDWTSRIDARVFQNKPAVFLATSPGGGGAGSVLESAVNSAQYFGADLVGQLSVPRFNENFDVKKRQLVNELFRTKLLKLMEALRARVSAKVRSEALVTTGGYPFK